jgi:hypothetical protein
MRGSAYTPDGRARSKAEGPGGRGQRRLNAYAQIRPYSGELGRTVLYQASCSLVARSLPSRRQ